MRNKVKFVLSLLVLVLAGCFHPATQSTSELLLLRKLSFVPPHGWSTVQPGPLHAAQWRSEDGKQFISLYAIHNARQLDISAIRRTNTIIRICGNQPAVLVQRRRPFNHVNSDSVETLLESNEVVSLYVYPYETRPDPRAETSIRKLCLKKR